MKKTPNDVTLPQDPPETPSPYVWRQLRENYSPQTLLRTILDSSIIGGRDWDELPADIRERLTRHIYTQDLLDDLVDEKLLTQFQVERVRAGKLFGLVLGNYRLLNRIGSGGMGTVYLAEHLRLRRKAAIKVRPLYHAQDPRIVLRFLREVQAVSQLEHPNIVNALDAGEVPGPDSESPTLHFLVMEYIPGEDLEAFVKNHGPLPCARACDVAYQVASALHEAHQQELVHRDIKPSNIMITPAGQAKLLDFGLARGLRNRVTEPGALLGTIDYIAPEQARDASTADIRADLYGLGGTLFWSLTGKTPFPPQQDLAQDLVFRLKNMPLRVRSLRPEIPQPLEDVVLRMMSLNPEDRQDSPRAVMKALSPFLSAEMRHQLHMPSLIRDFEENLYSAVKTVRSSFVHRVLIVDASAKIRQRCVMTLQAEGIACDEAASAGEALLAVENVPFDVIFMNWVMPGMDGHELCRRLRENPALTNIKIILFSSETAGDDLARVLDAGADDYVTKDFNDVQLVTRVKAALRLKDAQERSDLLNRQLLAINQKLERNLDSRDSDLIHARSALVLAMAKLVERRSTETGNHLVRMQRFIRCLAKEVASLPQVPLPLDANYIQMVESCVPLHDIGTVVLPDHILLKPGKLDEEERLIMQTHTQVGAATLKEVAERHGFSVVFFQTAIDISLHHHERFDGSGYPDRLQGADIPLAARLAAFGDVYDALRSRRPYRPALSHGSAVHLMRESMVGAFDPLLFTAFDRCAARFERIFDELRD